jgi:basic membrane protein A
VRHRRVQLGALALVLALGGAACSSNTTDTPSAGGDQTGSATAPGKDSKAVVFIFVGPKDDFGYNQAAYQGSQAVK